MATLSHVFEKKVHETNPKERYRMLDVFYTSIPTAGADKLIVYSSILTQTCAGTRF